MFGIDTNVLILSLALSIVGVMYWQLGKSDRPIFRYCGAAILLSTFFLNTVLSLLIVNAILIVIPLVLKDF